jgi:hypothetical protein
MGPIDAKLASMRFLGRELWHQHRLRVNNQEQDEERVKQLKKL